MVTLSTVFIYFVLCQERKIFPQKLYRLWVANPPNSQAISARHPHTLDEWIPHLPLTPMYDSLKGFHAHACFACLLREPETMCSTLLIIIGYL